MNKTNILAVADAIENHSIPDLGFNMGTFGSQFAEDRSGHNCGTVACIAGWAKAIAGNTADDPETAGLQFLDLSYVDAHKLFFGYGSPVHLDAIEPEHAVAVLRNLAETGDVDWSVACTD